MKQNPKKTLANVKKTLQENVTKTSSKTLLKLSQIKPKKNSHKVFFTKYIYIYKYFLNMFHMFSLVCFLFYSVNNRSGHDQLTTFDQISYVSGPKLAFWGDFFMILHGFAWRSSKNKDLRSTKFEISLKSIKNQNVITNSMKVQVFLGFPGVA